MSCGEMETFEMIVVEPGTILQAYSNGEGLDEAIDQVRAVVECFEHDMSTKTGRQKTASLAHKVSKVKTRLDAMGKDLVAGWKDQAKKVDASRKSMREALDELRDQARQPLVEWEAEEARKEAEKEARLKAEKLAVQLEADHEIGLLLNEKMDRDAAEEAAELERWTQAEAERVQKERAEREARIAAEAAETARREAAEAAAQKETEAARALADAKAAEERAKREAEERAAKAERDAIAAKEQAEREQEAAVKAAEAKAKAQEDSRLADQQRIETERKAREADTAHRRKVNAAALACLVTGGIEASVAKSVIKLIAKGEIDHVSISY